MSVIKKLAEELNSIPEDYIVLVETSAEKSFEISTAYTKLLSKKNDSGIIVSANRPYPNLVNIYKKNDIDVSKMFVLDCISKSLNGQDNNAVNVKYVENLSSLTDISLMIHEQINITNGRKFILFDSINTMLIHNKPYIFARFVHSILTKMRLNGIGGVLFCLEDDFKNKEIRAEIAQLCDKVIRI